MPEGDTVYRTAKNLDAALAGRTLTRCDIRVPAFATVGLTGEVVDGAASRGKHLLIRVGEHSIHSHLTMEGSWRVYRQHGHGRQPEWQARHSRHGGIDRRRLRARGARRGGAGR